MLTTHKLKEKLKIYNSLKEWARDLNRHSNKEYTQTKNKHINVQIISHHVNAN